MPFKPGHSGNPTGRAKITLANGMTLREMAREHTEKALLALVKVIDDIQAPHAAVVSASTALLDRGWGKPTQPVSGDEDAPPVQFVGGTPEQWAQRLKTDTLRDLASVGGGDDQG